MQDWLGVERDLYYREHGGLRNKTHGVFVVQYGGNGDEVAEAIGEVLFFHNTDDFSVENFWCFNPRDRRDDGEL